ncbi:MAG: ABC transporter permease [Gemmatimonadales bacterium]
MTTPLLTMRARPDPASAPSTVLTLGWRAMLKIKHEPFQLFDVSVMPIMFTLLFTYIFGGALAGTPRAYVQYLLPGVLVQTVIFITVYTGMGLTTDIQKGLYDRFRSLPMWQPSPIFGALLGDVFRYSVASAVILIVGFILGFRPAGGVVGVLLAVGLVLIFAFALSWLWIIVGMLVRTPESVMTTSFVFLMPLTFASDIFVNLSTMPAWLQAVVGRNPVTYLAKASRGLMHGQPVWAEVGWVLVAAAAIVLVAAPIAMRMYRKER